MQPAVSCVKPAQHLLVKIQPDESCSLSSHTFIYKGLVCLYPVFVLIDPFIYSSVHPSIIFICPIRLKGSLAFFFFFALCYPALHHPSVLPPPLPSCWPGLPSESVLNICRQAVVEVYRRRGCLRGPHYGLSCINRQLLPSHLGISTLWLLQRLLGH